MSLPAVHVFILASLLAGCGSSAPVRYYRIDAMELQATAPATATRVLAIGRINFPDYLQQPYMVRRGPGVEMVVDEQNRWAEPLEKAVPRIVASNIEALIPGIAVVAERSPIRPDYRLFATVHRLDTDARGHTVLVLQWGVTSAEGETRIAPGIGRYHSQAAPAGGPNAMAAAISDVLAQFSRDVATLLQTR